MRTALSALASVALVLALAGCSSDTGGVPRGTCLEFAAGEFADLSSVVECTASHRYDVLGSATWPGVQEAIDAEGAEAVHAAIMDFSQEDYWAWAPLACEQQLRESQGLSGVSIDGVDADTLHLNPSGRFYVDHSLADVDSFVSGDRATVCSVAWLDVNDQQVALAHAEGENITGLVSGDLSTIDAHSCFDREGPGDQPAAACSEGHNGEYLMVFDGGVALADWVETFDPVSVIAPDYAPLDDYCTTLIDTVHPGVLDDPAWQVWGDHLLSFGGGWTGFDGTVDPEQRYMFYCGVLRTAADSVSGSVVIGDVTSAPG